MKVLHPGAIHVAAALVIAASGCATGVDPGGVGHGGAPTTSGSGATTASSSGVDFTTSSSSSSTTSSSTSTSSTTSTSTSSSTSSTSTSTSSTTSSSTSSTSSTSTSSGGPLSCQSSYCNLGDGGYGFAYADSQNKPPQNPGTSTATLSTSGLCISGNVMQVVASDFSDDWGCGIGFNLNQAMGTNTPVNAYTLTGTGVTVSTSAVPSCTSARVVLDQNGGTTYCAPLTPGVEMPWSSFNTACWNNSGTFLGGPPTSQAIKIQFVSSATMACAYTSFCITQISL